MMKPPISTGDAGRPVVGGGRFRYPKDQAQPSDTHRAKSATHGPVLQAVENLHGTRWRAPQQPQAETWAPQKELALADLQQIE